jgi:hypothetical protein
MELITCSVCETRNLTHRRVCLSCAAPLSTTEAEGNDLSSAKKQGSRGKRSPATRIGVIFAILLGALSISYYLVGF